MRLFLFNKILFLFSFFWLIGCQPEKVQITPAFYHWQTNFELSKTEINYLNALSIQKIYPKFFDVDWDFNKQGPVALAPISMPSELPSAVALIEIIPTVFITNRTLVQLPTEKLPDLAEKIIQKLTAHMEAFEPNKIQEIQFDCDWSQSTKAKYFSLLTLLNNTFEARGIYLSATIRLHQIKYAHKTGVPPVKRGVLMYYNMGEVQKETTVNSILDNAIGAKYLSKLADYPLPLDVALPLFQWGVLFRKDKMIKLLNQLSTTALVDTQRFTQINKNHWEVIKSTYLNGVYLYKGDKIRLEKSELTDLKKAAELLQKQSKIENRSIIFYHLDSTVLRHFKVEDLAAIINQLKIENDFF